MVVTTSTTVQVNDDYESKDSLVISAAGGTSGGERLGRSHISPRQGLTVAFRSAVETIQNQLLLAVALGLVIALFTMLGVDKRRWEAESRLSRLSSI